MKICTPETFLGKENQRYAIHHGTCDSCGKEMVLVYHIRYDKQPNSYRLCLSCSHEMMDSFAIYIEKREDENV